MSDLRALLERIVPALERSNVPFMVTDHATGWKIDFIVRRSRPFSREEFERRSTVSLLGIDVPMASPEDTILAKLEWSKASGGSERQRRDIVLGTDSGATITVFTLVGSLKLSALPSNEGVALGGAFAVESHFANRAGAVNLLAAWLPWDESIASTLAIIGQRDASEDLRNVANNALECRVSD